MQVLAIDFGLKKVGVAISAGYLAEPYRVLHYESQDDLIRKIINIVSEEGVGKIVVGVSEGKMASASRKFAALLKKTSGIEVSTIDETLTTKEAQQKSIESGMKRMKRKKMEDAYAAALILQKYLDSQ